MAKFDFLETQKSVLDRAISHYSLVSQFSDENVQCRQKVIYRNPMVS